MADLVAWLREQLDEDEAAARAATPGPWRYDPGKEWRNPKRPFTGGEEAVFAGSPGAAATTVTCTGPSDDRQSMDDARHIARWDPARVLAEVAAKRAVLDGWEVSRGLSDDAAGWEGAVYCLAQPYTDRPGFDPAWRVDGVS